MGGGHLTPEQQARVEIDAQLVAAGWLVQNHIDMELSAGNGIAVREFPTATGPADYVLYVGEKVVGTIEAKKQGVTLAGVEPQADRYAEGFATTAKEKGLPYWVLPLPFHYMSTGAETRFMDRRDPHARPREVFSFHRPETLVAWAQDEKSLRARLQELPVLDTTHLRGIQTEAIKGLEASFCAGREKSLVAMTMGSGKTRVAVEEAYRLIRHGEAKRILFLVDRINLGEQARDEFRGFVTPDDGRKFSELYNVQLLRSNHIDPASRVVITTIQRLYAILRGQPDAEFDPESEQASTFELAAEDSTDFVELPVVYQSIVPIEEFDFIFTDECHRSIYGRWGQVLDYFDAFLVGLTATPSKFTYGYFEGNVVANYTHEQSVVDGINVDYLVYRIKTKVTEEGGEIEAGEFVRVRDKITRKQAYQKLEDELVYEAEKLDRAVVAEDQIRTVIRAFRDKALDEMFPDRSEVPKTVFFCKDDGHAEDVLKVIRDEFGRGAEFAKKITYRTEGSSQQHIQDFRTNPAFRIAVSVDQISTGTDIRAIECLVFMRMVKSRALFEQMKGRGTRKVDKDEFWAVTPGAKDEGAIKDHFVIVDCVGISDEDRAWAESKPLDRDPSRPLKGLLQDIAQGVRKDDVLATIAARLTRLQQRLEPDDEEGFAAVAGQSLGSVAARLVAAIDEEQQAQRAKADLGEDREFTEEEMTAARAALVTEAVAPLMKAEVRQKILSLQTKSEQIIDLITQDELLEAGYVDAGQARQVVDDFQKFIEDHHDEFVALKAYYQQPYKSRPTLKDLKDLGKAIESPPYNLTPRRIWRAYEKLEESKVNGSGGRVMTDLVELIRFALEQDDELQPHKAVIDLRFDIWLAEQQSKREFSQDQLRWLTMVKEHIATSMTIEKDDFDLEPFAQEGGLLAATGIFDGDLDGLLAELNEALAR